MSTLRLERLATPALALFAFTGTPASVRAQRAASSRAVVTVIDSMILREPDSLYLASPTFLAPAPDGGVYVSELFSSRVIEYNAAGVPVTTLGRKGTGPGEFVSPGPATVVADSLLVVHDPGQRGFSVFNRKTGRFIRLVHNEGVVTTISASHDTVTFAVINLRKTRMSSLAVWPVAGDSIRYFGPLPAEYLRSRSLAQSLPLATFASWGSSMLVGFAGHQDLFLTDSSGAIRDTVNIPARLRRGVPRDLVEQYGRPQTSEQEASRNSIITSLHHLRSGHVAAIHFDYVVEGSAVTGTGYLSLVDPTLHRACVDTPLNLGRDARPFIAWRGDTLLVLEQRVIASDRAISVVRSYRIDPSACTWQPVGSPGRN